MLTPAQIKARYETRREKQHDQNHLFIAPVPVAKEAPVTKDTFSTLFVKAAKSKGVADKQIFEVLRMIGRTFDGLYETQIQVTKNLVARIEALEARANGNSSGR